MGWRLKTSTREGDKREVPLTGKRFVVGRSASCDVVIDNEKLSRAHFRIDIDGDAVKVSDLLSSGGTLVDDRSITETPVPVMHGSKIFAAGQAFVLVTDDESAATRVEPAPPRAADREALPVARLDGSTVLRPSLGLRLIGRFLVSGVGAILGGLIGLALAIFSTGEFLISIAITSLIGGGYFFSHFRGHPREYGPGCCPHCASGLYVKRHQQVVVCASCARAFAAW